MAAAPKVNYVYGAHIRLDGDGWSVSATGKAACDLISNIEIKLLEA